MRTSRCVIDKSLAGDRIVAPGRIADQQHAFGERLVDPRVVVRIYEARADRSPGGNRIAAGHGLQTKRLEKPLRSLRAGEPRLLFEAEADVQPDAPAALRERQHVHVAFDRDELRVVAPLRYVVDQHAREPMVRFVLLQLRADLFRRFAVAPVGANDQTRPQRGGLAVVIERNGRRRARRDPRVRNASQISVAPAVVAASFSRLHIDGWPMHNGPGLSGSSVVRSNAAFSATRGGMSSSYDTCRVTWCPPLAT